MNKIKNAQQMLDILEPIPEEKWCTQAFFMDGRCCAIGHINVALGKRPEEDYYGFGAREITKSYLKSKDKVGNIATVNNWPSEVADHGYSEDTPKARVIHLLKDMIRDGY